jgi:hypothetical protein
MDAFAPLSRARTRRGMNEQASAWLGAVDGLPAVHARLSRVVLLNRDAVDVIQSQDGPGTMFYLDPPYLTATRAAPGVYRHELTADDHRRLLGAVKAVEGKVILSGYPSDLYDRELAGWARRTSGGGRGMGAGPMTIKQTATDFTITRTTPNGEMSTTYKLDGTEHEITMGQGTAKATAKLDGSKIVIKSVRETQNGTMESTATYTLSADGKELTVVNASSRGERKMVYNKQ